MKAHSLVRTDGTKVWLLNGMLHREDGPAEEYPNGDTSWLLNGVRHRTDGPAVEWTGWGIARNPPLKEWWIHGTRIDCKTQEEFEQYMRMRAFW
jgi:hypothetical protein